MQVPTSFFCSPPYSSTHTSTAATDYIRRDFLGAYSYTNTISPYLPPSTTLAVTVYDRDLRLCHLHLRLSQPPLVILLSSSNVEYDGRRTFCRRLWPPPCRFIRFHIPRRHSRVRPPLSQTLSPVSTSTTTISGVHVCHCRLYRPASTAKTK